MPFDPISAALTGGGMILDLFKNAGAATEARRNQAYQREALARAAANAEAEAELRRGYAQTGQREALRLAGSLRQDQFGNATYYDPNQGRWVTYITPLQQAIIDEGQQRQRRAQIRGAQASQDYDTLRGEYLYQRPKSEAESYLELIKLINQAQGTAEQQLNTLNNRFGIRTAGNLPQFVQTDRGPSPGQQLAETMLQARKAALEEYGTREKLHQSRYLPALKQFEDTANYVAPVDPTGSSIVGLTQQGMKDMLGAQSDYDKLIASIVARTPTGGGGGGGTAGTGGTNFANALGQLGKLLSGSSDKTGGTTGGTSGARASTSGGGGLFGGAGGEGGYWNDAVDPGAQQDYRPYTGVDLVNDPWASVEQNLTLGSKTGMAYGSPYAATSPYLSRDAYDFGGGSYSTPWSF